MTPEQVKASYTKALQDVVSIRRFTGSGLSRTSNDYEAKARMTGYQEHELSAQILQGDRLAIVYADDLSSILPVTKNDKVVVRGKELAIIGIDDNKRRVGETLIALEIQCRG